MLGKLGLFVWAGTFYALNLCEHLGVLPGGLVRVGAAHYNTPEEIEWLLEGLRDLG